jgi:hypothetical protein
MIIIETFERGTTPRTRPATLSLAIGFDSSLDSCPDRLSSKPQLAQIVAVPAIHTLAPQISRLPYRTILVVRWF